MACPSPSNPASGNFTSSTITSIRTSSSGTAHPGWPRTRYFGTLATISGKRRSFDIAMEYSISRIIRLCQHERGESCQIRRVGRKKLQIESEPYDEQEIYR